jgi:hypothetical protein
MEESKLIEILRTLRGRELGMFLEYVQSPYINKHGHLQELSVYLSKFAPLYSHKEKLDKYYIFAQLYPDTPYDDSVFYSLFSKLLRLLYSFLSHQEWEKEKGLEEVFLLRQLRERKVGDKHALASHRRFDSLQKQPVNSGKEELYRHWDDFLFYRELDLDFLGRGGRSYDENLQLKNNRLDLLFLLEKLKIACDMLNRNIVTQAEYEPTMLAELIEYIDRHSQPAEENSIFAEPSLQIYRCIIDTLRSIDNLDYYQQLKTLLLQHYPQIEPQEASNMFGYLLNYCIRKINAGQVDFFEEIWQHYQLLVETKIIYINGELPPWEYKQIITTALRLGKNDWCRDFAEQYKNDLPEDSRENAYCYNMAAIHYSNQNYRGALMALQNTEFTDTTYQLGARILQVKAYYELNESEALRSLFESFAVYIRRSKEISEYRKTANNNFLRFVRKIYQCKTQWRENLATKTYISKKIGDIVAEMLHRQPTANKDWLQNIIVELKDKVEGENKK